MKRLVKRVVKTICRLSTGDSSARNSSFPQSEIHPSVLMAAPERMSIGEYVYIGPGCELYGLGGIVIGNHTIFGPRVTVLSSTHRYENATMIPYDEIELLKKVSIGNAVWVGYGAIIMPGAELGDGCIVAAGAVVTKTFSPGSVVGGNPARIIKQRDMAAFEDLFSREKFYLSCKTANGFQKKEIRVS